MPAATLSQITGKQFTMTEQDNTPSYKLSACDYTNTASAQGINQLRIDIIGKGGAVGLSADVDAAKQVKSSSWRCTRSAASATRPTAAGSKPTSKCSTATRSSRSPVAPTSPTDQGKQIISQLHSKL